MCDIQGLFAWWLVKCCLLLIVQCIVGWQTNYTCLRVRYIRVMSAPCSGAKSPLTAWRNKVLKSETCSWNAAWQAFLVTCDGNGSRPKTESAVNVEPMSPAYNCAASVDDGKSSARAADPLVSCARTFGIPLPGVKRRQVYSQTLVCHHISAEGTPKCPPSHWQPSSAAAATLVFTLVFQTLLIFLSKNIIPHTIIDIVA